MDKVLKEKVILLLMAGVVLGFSRNPFHHYRVYKNLSKEWQKIDGVQLKEAVRQLYRSKVISEKRNSNGTFTFVLSDKGRLKSLTYRFNQIKIKKETWDKKWRAVFFDIPEKYRWGRDALRKKLRELGFCELQKSVFVFPYECEDEIDFVIEYYGIRKYARFATIDYIDDDLYLKSKFELS